ncbi:MAG: hypothetical protein JST87_05505 [Bacteroidetes bacterium]|nr:hypothetical protein [Bacteroidota bacterium]
MKLTSRALRLINNKDTRLRLALALGFTEQWVIKLIDDNKDNGPLTTAKALQVIKGETKLTDTEILIEEPIRA